MKHMKKSMFITTVMMVVLLIVAVSTATFAWYTSSNTVNTLATQVNSAESTGANISIGWEDTTPVGVNQLTFDTNSNPYNPMVPINMEGDAALTFATINNNTPFATSSLSFGQLSGISSATPYIGKSGSDSTFYVINYALKATDITFDVSVTGDNALRLRVAVFVVGGDDNGKLVFVNRDFSYGTQMNAVAEHYAVMTVQPADWGVNFSKSYYTRSGEEGSYVYSAVVGQAPVFQNNTYYLEGVVQNNVDAEVWASDFGNYTTIDGTPVAAVAPTFVADTYYKLVPNAPEYLACDAGVQKITAQSVATRIALSNGTQGSAQGFIVKAWFDGPTQVDAYGGQNATFTLTATAAVVAG